MKLQNNSSHRTFVPATRVNSANSGHNRSTSLKRSHTVHQARAYSLDRDRCPPPELGYSSSHVPRCHHRRCARVTAEHTTADSSLPSI